MPRMIEIMYFLENVSNLIEIRLYDSFLAMYFVLPTMKNLRQLLHWLNKTYYIKRL